MNVKSLYILVLMLASIAMGSCTSIDCSVNSLVECVCGFRDADDETVQLNYPITVTTSRSIDGSDTALINKQASASQLQFPMSYTLPADTLRFTLSNDTADATITDTIIIRKTNEPVFESVDCNARYHHTIQDISLTHHFIDSIVVNNPNVSNDLSTENIHIYLRSN